MIKLLIIDDDEKRKDRLIKVLLSQSQSNFIDVKYCDTADKARELCKNNRYDVLVLDVCLPKKNGYTATKKEGIKLLKDLNTNPKYFLPTKVIGITAVIDSIDDFRSEFMSYTSVVYEATINNAKWIQDTVANIISITNSTIVDKNRSKKAIVISLHGIRTYGHWQNELSTFIQDKTEHIEYHPFKYGFFSVIFFFIPLIRYIKSKSIIKSIKKIIDENKDKEVYIFAHSYGTYVISKLIELNEFDKKINTVFFCGSVLPSSYDIHGKLSSKVNKIVNDCAIKDYVLIINKIFIPFLGNAGRVGFEGVNNNQICNRYFKGGHSLYFNKVNNHENFMEKYWMPHLIDDKEFEIIDERSKNTYLSDFTEPIILILTLFMNITYMYLIYSTYTYFS